jgi:hypothetical protein
MIDNANAINFKEFQGNRGQTVVMKMILSRLSFLRGAIAPAPHRARKSRP